MNTGQVASFKEGTGDYFTADDLLTLVQGIGATVVLLYVAWLCITAYNDYGAGNIKANDMLIIWSRGVFAMMILLFLIT